MVEQLIISGGKKYPHIFHYNLPPKETCKPSAWCLSGMYGRPRCYALRGNFLFPSVQQAAQERLAHTKEEDFVERFVDELQQKNVKYFRWHRSGDFYSETYVRKVIAIAEACPEVKFRTTTRRRDLEGALVELNALPNFVVRESLDHSTPEPTTKLPFVGLKTMLNLESYDTIDCPSGCDACGYVCWKEKKSMLIREF